MCRSNHASAISDKSYYTYCLPLYRFRSYAVISIAFDQHAVVARPWPGGEKRRGGRASHHEECEAIGSFLLTYAATGLSLVAVWCLSGATPRAQPWTPAVTLSHGRNGAAGGGKGCCLCLYSSGAVLCDSPSFRRSQCMTKAELVEKVADKIQLTKK